MIISASYKTDIPAFYSAWFMNRVRAGYCKMVNPYGRQVYTINLLPGPNPEVPNGEAVEGIVFWTKNIGPLLTSLGEIRERGYPFVVQHTINGYPRELESRVVDYDRAVAHMRALRNEFGPRVAIWRYDPIILSSLTSIDWHLDHFAALAGKLAGTTDEVVVSVAQIYQKTKRNMDEAARERGFEWAEHEVLWGNSQQYTEESIERGRHLLLYLAGIARAHGMKLTVCSQPHFLVPGLLEEAHCVEAARLARVAEEWGLARGDLCDTKRQKGNRKECACSASRDIGEYDTCPHGCVYCYAVRNRSLALERYKVHDPAGEFLFPPREYVPERDDVALKVSTPAREARKRRGVGKTRRGEELTVIQPRMPF